VSPELNPKAGAKDNPDSLAKRSGASSGSLAAGSGAELSALATGARLGPYEIRGPIAAGGMGEVYRAYDTRLARDVALKVLPTTTVDRVEALARFEREARAVAALNHPNILALYDVGSEGDVHFAVTELLEGETLRQRLADGRPLAPSKAVEFGVQIARGLAAAHDRGIVHRDLKPENVFVTVDGRVKILDFGIALYESPAAAGRTDTAPAITRTGFVLGTVGYVSPEQLLGSPATPRSDLFAFGVVLYEMLTGTHPFKRATLPEIQTAILREDPTSITHLVPRLAPAVVRMIELCLQKHPTDRPESARDLGLFLEAIGNVTGAGPATGAGLDVRSSRPLRAWLLAISCGLLLMLTGAIWGFVRLTADRAVNDVIDADLTRAERVIRRLHSEHLQRLALTARLVASFPELKALFGTDVATIEDFLLGFQQRITGTPMLVALGPDGAVLARTDNPGQRAAAAGEQWLAALTTNENEGTVIAVDDRPYVAAGAASEAAGTIFGYVVAAEPVNQTLADRLSEATQDEVVLLTDRQVLASTLRSAQTPWRSLADLKAGTRSAGGFGEVQIGTLRYATREVSLSDAPAVSAIILKSRDEAIGPYLRMQRGLLVLGVVALGGVFLGALWLWKLLRDQRKPATRTAL
jgi:hypothetical protein